MSKIMFWKGYASSCRLHALGGRNTRSTELAVEALRANELSLRELLEGVGEQRARPDLTKFTISYSLCRRETHKTQEEK